jgi:hypothetical protein
VVFTEHYRYLAGIYFRLGYYCRYTILHAREHKSKRGACLGLTFGDKIILKKKEKKKKKGLSARALGPFCLRHWNFMYTVGCSVVLRNSKLPLQH